MNIRAKIFGGEAAAEEPILKAKKPKGAKADTLHSVKVEREAQRRSNARAEDRHRLSGERARLKHNGTDVEVELINLSGGGAMVKGPFEPLIWDRVDLHLGNHGTIECAVRWIRDDCVGLEFAHETRLDWPSDQVAIVLRHVIERTFPHIHFPESGEKPPVAQPEIEDEHRAAPRHPLVWNGTLHHDYQSTPIRVRNISRTGAMIEVGVPVRVGADPVLELTEATALSATVEWAVGDQVGLRFHTPFEMEMLSNTRPSVVSEWKPPSYLDSETPSAHIEDHWGRLDLYQLRDELEGFLKH